MTVRLPKNENGNISDSKDIARIMQKILLRQNKYHRNKEYFWAIGLNNSNDIVYIELVTIGTSNRNILAPMKAFRLAVLKDCERLVLCHNHPSGKVEPSKADKQFTEDMRDAGTILGIKLLDHIIISENDHAVVDKK